jgi:hypothetical protein
MRADSSTGGRAPPPLAYRINDGSTAAEIAAACGEFWGEVEGVLRPIIGPRGVTALGRRSLHLASAAHPWLASHPPGGPATLDAALFVSLLAHRSSDEAAAAGAAFFQTLRELLGSLIGASLSEKLLRTVWGPPDAPLNSANAQDPTT